LPGETSFYRAEYTPKRSLSRTQKKGMRNKPAEKITFLYPPSKSNSHAGNKKHTTENNKPIPPLKRKKKGYCKKWAATQPRVPGSSFFILYLQPQVHCVCSLGGPSYEDTVSFQRSDHGKKNTCRLWLPQNSQRRPTDHVIDALGK